MEELRVIRPEQAARMLQSTRWRQSSQVPFRERRDLSAHPGVARDRKDENRVAAQQASCIIAGGKKAKMNFPLSCSNTEMLAREFTVVTRRVWPLWLDEYLPFYCAPR